MNTSEHINHLYNRYVSAEATEAELTELFALAEEPANEPVFMELFSDSWQELYRIDEELKEVQPDKRIVHRIHFLRTAWFRYAAAVILLLGGIATWYQLSRPSHLSLPQGISRASASGDIARGINKAILTLGDKTINLASDKTGINIGNTITYNDGSFIEGVTNNMSPGEAGNQSSSINSITTPRGGQYQAVLPDGSKVWLNAASSIRFPTKFSADKREIKVIGEVYIEVVKNTKQPFYVHTHKTTIQVLGTSFNINAYNNEEVEKTTLIEGSIKIKMDKKEELLKPGEQAIIKNQNISLSKLNRSADVIAWKNGYFNFEEISFAEAMRQLERWYDLQVVYEKGIPTIEFGGKISRNLSFSDLLKGFTDFNIKYRVEGRKLILNNWKIRR